MDYLDSRTNWPAIWTWSLSSKFAEGTHPKAKHLANIGGAVLILLTVTLYMLLNFYNFKTQLVAMSKWDDDFDFEDDAPKNKKPLPDKKKPKDNDFFDDEDGNKLPSISSKNAISK